jgi:DNA mismatch repair protein MutL
MEVIESQQPQITRLGFELRQRSDRTASVHQVPRLLHRADPERLVLDLLNELARQGRSFSEGLDLVLATMACHAAVRAGDVVTRSEGEALLRALDEVRFSGHCPHGRPIVTFTPWSELERKVGRR